MKTEMNVMVLAVESIESKKEQGKFYNNVTVMYGDEIIKFSCEQTAVENLRKYKMKMAKVVFNISSFKDNIIVRVTGVSE